MLRHATVFLLALLITPAITAQAQDKDASPEVQYQQLVNQFRAAQMELSKAFRAAKTPEEQLALRKKMSTIGVDYTPQFMKLAKAHAADPVAVDALSWIITGASRFGGKGADEALQLLAENHIKNEKLAVICERLRNSSLRGAVGFLETVLEKSPHHDAQGHACYSLAYKLKRSAGNTPANLAKAEALFDRLATEFADVKTRTSTLGTVATSELFEIRNLSVGKPAPEILGQDIDGVEFKLSDYRGQVVVLDFWGHW